MYTHPCLRFLGAVLARRWWECSPSRGAPSMCYGRKVSSDADFPYDGSSVIQNDGILPKGARAKSSRQGNMPLSQVFGFRG